VSAQTDLNTSIKYIKGVGPKRAEALSTAGIGTVNDLLHYYPRRYLDRTTVKSIRDVKKGDQATMVGTVEVCGERQARKRKLFQAVLSDGTGMITLVWFNGVKYIKNAIQKGDRLAIHGKVEFYNGFQIVHPDFDKLDSDADPINTGTIIPLYPLTAELKKDREGMDLKEINLEAKITGLEEALANALAVNESHQKLNGTLQERLTEVEDDNKKLSQQVEDQVERARKAGM